MALVEKHFMGGDCLNVGCVPSKALIAAARAAAAVQNAGEFGVVVPPGTSIDFERVMERMQRLRADLSENDSAARFRNLGVDVFLGAAEFTADGAAVRVGNSSLRFKKAVIATGSHASIPSIRGLEEAGYLTNETVFSLTALPRRMAVIGGGPIGCELAQAFARFGSRVSLFHSHKQILRREDADAAQVVEQALRRDGVEFLCDSQIDSVHPVTDGKSIAFESHGLRRELVVDAILVAVGRAPNVAGLNLQGAAVNFDPRTGVQVNDHLQTTNPRVFAAGDVCSAYQFTHAADAQARIVIQNALFLGRAKASALMIPRCTYTTPEIAHVGLTAKDAETRGISVQSYVQQLSHLDRAVLDGESEGFAKVLVRRNTDQIVGATIVASRAGDLISEISVALQNGIGLKGIGRTIHPYPTQADAIHKIADQFQRTRLTPILKSLIHTWLRWTQ